MDRPLVRRLVRCTACMEEDETVQRPHLDLESFNLEQ